MTTASEIRAGLISRGLPPHIADGFVMNFEDESGLNPTITEAEPNVHGTFGRGLFQVTGPRRVAYERQYGDSYDVDSQLDYLMYELQGPESAAWERIRNTSTPGEAGAAIVSHFLRPAAQHRDRRIAEYLGGAMPDYSDQGMAFAPSGQNALASVQPQQDQAMNALAMLDQFRPQTNALRASDFMSRPNAMQLQPMPVYG